MTAEQSVAPAAEAQPVKKKKHTRNALATAKGGGIVASGQLFAYGMRFVLAYLLARALGADQYGLYTIALSTATVVAGVAVFGLHTAMVRYVAVFSRKKSEDELWGLLQFGMGLTLLISTALAIGLFALSYVVADRIYHRPELTPLLQVMAVTVPFMTMGTLLNGATDGFKKMHYGVIAQNMAQTIVRLILIAIMFVIGMKAIHAVIIFAISNVVTTGLLLYFLHREFPLNRSLRIARHNRREILSFSVPVWISGLLSTFRSNIQTLLLGTYYTAAGVGIFNVVGRVNLVGRMAFNSIGASARPVIAEIDASDDRKELANIYQTTGRWAFTVNLPIFLVLMIFSEGILAIFGKDFIAGATAMRILALAELADVLTGICGVIIDMTGQTRLKVTNSTVQLVLAIAVNILLIPPFGLLGAAVGAFIVNAVINNLRMIQVWYLYRILPFNRSFIKPLAAGLAAAAAALLTLQLGGGELSLLLLIVQVAVLFAVYTVVIYLLGLPTEERVVINRLWAKVRRGRLRNA
jgi:O-antigen/teichoic acid export membrane protein